MKVDAFDDNQEIVNMLRELIPVLREPNRYAINEAVTQLIGLHELAIDLSKEIERINKLTNEKKIITDKKPTLITIALMLLELATDGDFWESNAHLLGADIADLSAHAHQLIQFELYHDIETATECSEGVLHALLYADYYLGTSSAKDDFLTELLARVRRGDCSETIT